MRFMRHALPVLSLFFFTACVTAAPSGKESEFYKLYDQYRQALIKQDFEAAYSLLSKNLKERLKKNGDTFQQSEVANIGQNGFGGFSAFEPVAVYQRVNGNSGCLTIPTLSKGKIAGSDEPYEDRNVLVFGMVQEENLWKFDYIQILPYLDRSASAKKLWQKNPVSVQKQRMSELPQQPLCPAEQARKVPAGEPDLYQMNHDFVKLIKTDTKASAQAALKIFSIPEKSMETGMSPRDAYLMNAAKMVSIHDSLYRVFSAYQKVEKNKGCLVVHGFDQYDHPQTIRYIYDITEGKPPSFYFGERQLGLENYLRDGKTTGFNDKADCW